MQIHTSLYSCEDVWTILINHRTISKFTGCLISIQTLFVLASRHANFLLYRIKHSGPFITTCFQTELSSSSHTLSWHRRRWRWRRQWRLCLDTTSCSVTPPGIGPTWSHKQMPPRPWLLLFTIN